MKLSNVADLESFHHDIIRLRADYKPPLHLMSKVDGEYWEWLHGRLVRRGDPADWKIGQDPMQLGYDERPYYVWLALAIRLLKPKRILELGNWKGASTLMIYSEMPSETEFFTTVDLERNLDLVPETVFDDPRMRFVYGNDLDLTIYGESLPISVDFLFVDSLHEYQHIEAEWSIYRHLCAPGALVVLDDIHLRSMGEFWTNLPYPKLDVSRDCHMSGFGMFLYQPAYAQKQDSVAEISAAVIRASRSAL